jgi:hypothetical protein
MIWKNKTQWTYTLADQNKQETESQNLKDEMEIKGKTEELLVIQLKTCGRNMQGLSNSIKRKPDNHGHWRRRRGPSKRILQYIQQNNGRKFLKSREHYAHSGTGRLQDIKQT